MLLGKNIDILLVNSFSSEAHLRLLFEASGLTILQEKLQPHFPKELFPVKMFALCPGPVGQ